MEEDTIRYRSFRIEKLSENKSKDIVFLFKVVFNSQTSEEAVIKKHVDCDGNYKFVGFIGYHEETNEPAAYYAVYPRYMIHKGEKILSAQSGDTMTNPNFQKQGLFVELAEITFNYCQKIGIDVITGFPNKNSYPGFVKYLKFEELPMLQALLFKENRFEFHRITRYNELLSRIHFKFIKLIFSLFLRSGSGFQNSNKNNNELTYVNHNDQYFKLKEQEDKVIISIKGVSIWLKISYKLNSIQIADIDISEGTDINYLLYILKRITFISGLRFLEFQSSNSSYLYSKLKPLSISDNKGSIFIIRDLSGKLFLESFSLLLCDSDGF